MGSIPIHFRFFAFFILVTECRLTSGAPRDTFTETCIVQNQRKKLTESAWFWVYLFSTAGLIGLVILQGKFDTRQDLEEINFRARMQTYEEAGATHTTDQDNTQSEQLVTLTPLYILFGAIFAFSWAMIWKQRILVKSNESISTAVEPSASANSPRVKTEP